MTQFDPPPHLDETESNLALLLQEVDSWTGDLAGGKTVPVGVADIQKYLSAKIQFSNPTSNLTRLTPDMFEQVNVQLSPQHVQQMTHAFDFYFMTLSVQMRPEPGTYFRALGCILNFGPDDDTEPIVVSIFPDEQWKEVFNFGGSLELNLDGNFEFQVGIEEKYLDFVPLLPAAKQARVFNQSSMQSSIKIPAFSYSRGRFNIAAYGPDGPECYWYLDNDEISQTLTAQFIIVFKVPQGVRAISLQGVAWAEPDMDKLTANFRHVIRRFKDSLRNLFKGKNKGSRAFAITVKEVWDNLPLPQPMLPQIDSPQDPTDSPAASHADEIETAPLNHLQVASRFGKLLTKWFNEAELRTLCLDIGYDYENLPGRAKPERAQELALLSMRENTFAKLQAACKEERPYVTWDI
ncbi:MAG: hypothetical protein H6652_00185 [Ardenticatenaceae bacterium]|nr:hypothetical protein [Ardenticatenaceae bacterium]